MILGPGTHLGPYEIVSLLGRGGMGEVYRGRDTRLHRDVAIKVLAPGLADNPTRRARLEREARTISQLSHPNICAIYDIGEKDGVTFLVMEYISGQSLADRLRLGPVPWQTALPWAIEIASAIDAAHRRGVVHRDLKPANIMIGESGVKLLDFGIAKLLEEPDASGTAVTASLTGEHQIVGTLQYMSPEQLEGRDIDHRTDIFAFGATLYELLSGRRAFDGMSAASVSAAILTAEPAPLSAPDLNDRGVPRSLDHIVRRALAKDPGQRWQTARDVMIELQSIQTRAAHGLPADHVSPPASRASVARSTWIGPRAIAIASALIVVLGAAGWYFARDRVITLAVVLLEAATDTPGADTLDDGIIEDLINKLGQATPDRLRVIAHSSVRRYKGQKFDAHEAGRELSASMMLTMRIARQADNLVISLELVRANDGTSMWGQKYTTSPSNLFATEDKIALTALAELNINLNDDEKRRLSKRYTENLDAYRHYWTGMSLANRQGGSDANYIQSLQSFQKAIGLDPNYALAYLGQAQAYVGMAFEGFLPPAEALRLAREACAKANDLDPSMVEASSAPGFFEILQRRVEPAIAAFRKALRMNPDDPILHQYFATHLRGLGRWSDAIAEGRRALTLDPIGVQSNSDLATTFSWQGDLDRAIEQYRKTLSIDSKAGTVHELLADVYARAGRHDEAIAEMRDALTLADPTGAAAAAFGADVVTVGHDAAMKKLFQIQLDTCLQAARAGEYVSPMIFAQIYANLRDVENTFAFLRKAFDDQHPWLLFLQHDPTYQFLHADARFQALLREIGVAQQTGS